MSARLLLVDDEPSLVRGLTYALTREGYDVTVATDGEEAVTSALADRPDLVILDRMLPRLSGGEACRRIRAASDVPIIMLTARDSERDLVEGLAIGADDYVTKPFSAVELLSRIAALLRRRKLDLIAGEKAQLVVAEITIDLAADVVTVDGTAVALTPSEFKILRLLAASTNSVVPRRRIMEQLWGSSHVGDEHTCEVHISAIRRKIEREPFPRRLVTVRGQGYMLTDLD